MTPTPRSSRSSRSFAVASVVLACALVGAACGSSAGEESSTDAGRTAGGCDAEALVGEPLFTPPSDTSRKSASYDTEPVAPQSQDCDRMRTFLATPQPGFDLQSYVFYGHLETAEGTTIPFSTLTQRQAAELGTAESPALRVTAMTVNPGDGIAIGGVDGVLSSTVTESSTTNPFSRRTQQSDGSDLPPEYVDIRVVEGQLGRPGAVVELTGQLAAERMADPDDGTVPLQVSVRIRDVAGVGQWGYGPSGFFPQWLLPEQHRAVTDSFDGDVEAYLEATGEPLTDQGSYYYSSPVVDVESFTITSGDEVVARGTGGELLIDYVTQSFDAAAAAVVDGGVQWTEFSTLLDDDRTMKVGVVEQASVGTLPYAIELRADGDRLANGSLAASQRWPIDGITLTPDAAATWTSPRSGKTYTMRYTAELTAADGTRSSLTYEALYDDQELTVAGRTVYEGLFRVTGELDGETVQGYAWAEIQPAGSV
ncbi:lipocalin family protein [Rhabdothermincola salaria]|uniref:lipocalin family protein n=1 Tax=Rhabdothermincola salaria TaxID=2903142 RepID=UPI001E38E83C|nr:lipocalin family protein [Rhabdothermincola salaria]